MVPENLRYTKDHEWIRVEGDAGTVGITDHAQEELGDLVFVEHVQLGLFESRPFGVADGVAVDEPPAEGA